MKDKPASIETGFTVRYIIARYSIISCYDSPEKSRLRELLFGLDGVIVIKARVICETRMFRLNPHTHQPALLSDLNLLSDAQRERLTHSWAATFRCEVFERLDERAFASLYSDVASRPNIPVNVLVGLETLKAGFDWSDAEMIDAFTFNLQVRYALGYENLGAGEFDLRTVYHFRHRLSAHQQATGQNLLDQAFGQITVEQIAAFELKTGRLRMDSTQIASNIREMSRLQLLVEVAQRVHRMLNEAEQAHYAERLAPYLRGTSGQFIYHLKGQTTAPHLQHLGELFQTWVVELQPTYADHDTYQLLARVFREQFNWRAAAQPSDATVTPAATPANELAPTPDAAPPSEAGPTSDVAPPSETDRANEVIEPSGTVQPKPGTALRPDTVQSPDDLDAT